MRHIAPLLIKRLFLIGFLSFGAFIFVILKGYNYFDIEELKSAYFTIDRYVDKYLISSLFIFSGIYILAVFFSIPIKPFLKVLASLLFGLWIGFTVSLISATTGAMLAFLFIKYNWGEVSNSDKYKGISRFKSIVENNPILILLIARLVPIPFFIPNILAGIIRVKNSIFFFTTLVGIIPLTFIFVWIGCHFDNSVHANNINSLVDAKFILVIGGLILLALIPLLIKMNFIRNWFKRFL